MSSVIPATRLSSQHCLSEDSREGNAPGADTAKAAVLQDFSVKGLNRQQTTDSGCASAPNRRNASAPGEDRRNNRHNNTDRTKNNNRRGRDGGPRTRRQNNRRQKRRQRPQTEEAPAPPDQTNKDNRHYPNMMPTSPTASSTNACYGGLYRKR